MKTTMFGEIAYKREAAVIQSRIDTRKARGVPVTADMVWSWIKDRRPTWHDEDYEIVFQKVNL